MSTPEPLELEELVEVFADLREKRRASKRPVSRKPLNDSERVKVKRKAASRCHICGEKIDGENWQASHVFAVSGGGMMSVDNCLAAHPACNRERWHYSPEELMWIFRLGRWLRGQIEAETKPGRDAGNQFCRYRQRLYSRRSATV